MDVSVIIVNFNSSDYLAGCVASVRDHSRAADMEVIVVDNRSRPEERAAAERLPGVDLFIPNGDNLGFGAANNIGAARASGRYLLFLNPDCLLLNDAVGQFLGHFRARTTAMIGAAGCALVDGHGAPNHYCGSFEGHEPLPFLRNELRQAVKLLLPRFRQGAPKGGTTPATVADAGSSFPVDWINGAALFMPRQLFLEVGGFDEKIFLFSEEVDLQLRLARLGYERHILTGPRIAHLHEKGRPMGPATRAHFMRGRMTYMRKHFPGIPFHAARIGFWCITLLRALIGALGGRGNPREELLLIAKTLHIPRKRKDGRRVTA